MLRYLLSVRKLGRRARDLERECEALRSALESERERNRLREDALIDRILTLAGQYAISKQVKTEMRRPVASPSPVQLTAYEEAVRNAYREAASRVGRTQKDADEQFEAWRSNTAPAGESPFLESLEVE